MVRKLLTRKTYEKFLADLPKERCPFCDYRKYQIVLREGKNWVWVAALAPYWRYHTMLIPKRHFRYFWDMKEAEIKELTKLTRVIIQFYREKKLHRRDKSLIKQYVFFWRLRDNLYDPISKNIRYDHFHIHIAPDKDHSWEPIIDPKAHLWDVNEFRKS